jgi:predicted NodU family carbamoyl transferase
MNVMGEPIVNTPEEAYQMIVKTDMDYLVMNNFLIGDNS